MVDFTLSFYSLGRFYFLSLHFTPMSRVIFLAMLHSDFILSLLSLVFVFLACLGGPRVLGHGDDYFLFLILRAIDDYEH